MTDRWALAGIPLAIFGAYFLLHEHATCPTTGVLLVGAGCIGLGFFLLDSTGFKAFVSTVGSYLPWGAGKGHRDGDA